MKTRAYLSGGEKNGAIVGSWVRRYAPRSSAGGALTRTANNNTFKWMKPSNCTTNRSPEDEMNVMVGGGGGGAKKKRVSARSKGKSARRTRAGSSQRPSVCAQGNFKGRHKSVFRNSVDVTQESIIVEMDKCFHPKTAEYPYMEIAGDLNGTYSSEALRSERGLVGDYEIDPRTGAVKESKKLNVILDPTQESVLRIFFSAEAVIAYDKTRGDTCAASTPVVSDEESTKETTDAPPSVVDALRRYFFNEEDVLGDVFDLSLVSYTRWIRGLKFAHFPFAEEVGVVAFRSVEAAKQAIGLLRALVQSRETTSTTSSCVSPSDRSDDNEARRAPLQFALGKQRVHGSLVDILDDVKNPYLAFCVDDDEVVGSCGPPQNDVVLVRSSIRADAGAFYRAQATAGAIAVSGEFFHRKRYAIYTDESTMR